jgi:Protein of unknown function, DUF255
MNRLAQAMSPYLLQHAGNPVDWWEWGEEAFAEAHRRDVPVLISVGYAACHWSHVTGCTIEAWPCVHSAASGCLTSRTPRPAHRPSAG